MSSIQHLGTGRRKTSTARVILRPGTGNFTVNDQKFEQYFFDETHRMLVKRPWKLPTPLNKFDHSWYSCQGGGMHGQAGAVQHGVAGRLVEFSAELRGLLKKEGFLTRDPRMKERKKYGQPGRESASSTRNDKLVLSGWFCRQQGSPPCRRPFDVEEMYQISKRRFIWRL